MKGRMGGENCNGKQRIACFESEKNNQIRVIYFLRLAMGTYEIRWKLKLASSTDSTSELI